MQKKGLFAALLCGAICLTGCLKNIESESVTEVRKAVAQEKISIANLNNAQAEAETIKAKAEAVLTEAQAKLIEAQAAIAQAEATKIRVEAEIAAVEVEIAKVKLESQKVKLQEQKARLEQTLAEVEAAIAKADLIKQQALNSIAMARMQAEIDQINMQKNLIAAEQEVRKQIEKVDEQTARNLKAAWRNYSDASDKYYAAVADLMVTEGDIATMQYNLNHGLSVLSSNLQELEEYADLLLAEIEYVKSFEVISPEELNTVYDEALVNLETAYTQEATATQNVALLQGLFDEYESMLNPGDDQDKLAYVFNWRDGFIDFLRRQLDNFDIDFVASYDENGVPVVGIQGAAAPDQLPFFTPLFTGTLRGRPARVVPFYGEVNEVSTGEYYPLVEDGVISHHAIPITKAEFTPANIYSENINAVLAILELKAIAEAAEAQGELEEAFDKVLNGQINKIEPNEEGGKPEYEGSTPGLLETIDTYQAIYDVMKQYVDEANAAIEPAYAQIEMAERTYKVANDELRSSVVELLAYNMDLTDIAEYNEAKINKDLAKENVRAAANEVRKAAKKVRNLNKALYGQIDEDIVMPDDPEDEDFLPDYGGIISDEGLLTKQAAIKAAVAAQEVIVDEAKAKVTPAITQALVDAQTAFNTQVDEVIPAKYEAERKAWNEYQAAFAAWTINPTEATKEALNLKEIAYYGTKTGGSGSLIVKGALQELKDAIAETQATEAGDKTLMDKLIKAKEDFDEVNDPYEEELEKYEQGKKIEGLIDAAVEEAQTALSLAQEGLAFAKENLENAKERLATAKEAETIAYDKIKWMEDPNLDNIPEEEITLIKNVFAAIRGIAQAEEALDKDWENYNKIYDAYTKIVIPGETPEEDIVINLYEIYSEQLDPEYARLSRRDRPSDVDEWGWHEPVYSQSEGREPSIAQRLNNAKKHLETVQNTFTEEKDAIVEALADATQGIATVAENISKYESAKADYMAFGARIEEVYDSIMEEQKKIVDAEIAIEEASAMLEAIDYLENRVIYVDGEGDPYTMEDVEDLITYLQTGYYHGRKSLYFISINDCYEMIAEIEAQIRKYFISNEVNITVLAQLEAKADALQKKIEVYSALMDMYSQKIDELIGGNTPAVE